MAGLSDIGGRIISKIPLKRKCIGGCILKDNITRGKELIIPAEREIGGRNRFVFITTVTGQQEVKEGKPEALSFHLFGKYQYFIVVNLNHSAIDIKEKGSFTVVYDFNFPFF